MFRAMILSACLVLSACAEDPFKSYGTAKSAAECREQFEQEFQAWDQEVTDPQERKSRASRVNLSNALGIAAGEELFRGRLNVCLKRVAAFQPVLRQPGTLGQHKVFTCRRGGGVFQGGAAICPGH